MNISVIVVHTDLILNGGLESVNVLLDIPFMELNVFPTNKAMIELLIAQLELSLTNNKRNVLLVLLVAYLALIAILVDHASSILTMTFLQVYA